MSLSNIINIQERGGSGTSGSSGGGGRGGSGGGGRGGSGGKRTPAPTPNQPKTDDSAEYTEIKKDYPKITIYSRLFVFLTDNGKFVLNPQDADFGDILVNTNDKKMLLGYNLPTAFIKSVVEKYPQIIKVSVPEKIGNDKVELQFEFFKRIKGLQTILEQAQTPNKYITYKIVDGKLKEPTEDDNWINATYKTIKTIADGGPEIKKGERSDTVVKVKEVLGYTKDGTPLKDGTPTYSPYFTQDFDEFLIKYKGTNGMDNTNGYIDQDFICNLEINKKKIYQKYCKTTAPPTNTTSSTPTNTTSSTPTNTTVIPTTEMKYLNDYAKYVGDGIPAYGTCKSLFDYYSQQALNYRRLKRVNKEPKDTEGIKKQLEPIKEKILYCQKSSDLKDRAKLDTLISQRFRIQQDKDSPYYVDI
jgi:hypothetical protein